MKWFDHGNKEEAEQTKKDKQGPYWTNALLDFSFLWNKEWATEDRKTWGDFEAGERYSVLAVEELQFSECNRHAFDYLTGGDKKKDKTEYDANLINDNTYEILAIQVRNPRATHHVLSDNNDGRLGSSDPLWKCKKIQRKQWKDDKGKKRSWIPLPKKGHGTKKGDGLFWLPLWEWMHGVGAIEVICVVWHQCC